MASGSSGVVLKGDVAKVDRMFRKLSEFDRRDALEEIGEAMVSSTVRRIRNGQGADGQPLKPVKNNRRRRPNKKPLVETGRLRSSIEAQASGEEVRVGTNVVYARTHQLGDDDRGIPARPFLGLDDDDRDAVDDVLKDAVRKVLR